MKIIKTKTPKGSRTETKRNISYQTDNTYCLKCKKPGCFIPEHEDYKFTYWYKYRVPLNVKKRAVFRKFLDDCPGFIYGVSVEQRPLMLDLLREVKYFSKEVDPRNWASIKK